MKTIKTKIASFLTSISPSLNIKVMYYYYYRKWLSFKSDPDSLDTLDEKIQWLKYNKYRTDPLYTICADKYKVREFVKESGCSEILNELYGVYDSVEEIDWLSLPEKFVLKWNFGSGFNFICTNKSEYDQTKVLSMIRKWGRTKSHLPYAEMQYKNIPKKILLEKYLEPTKGGRVPDDYKVYCFNGKPTYILVCQGRENGNPKFYFFDTSWSLARINKDSIAASENFSLPKPKALDHLLYYSTLLSSKFDFVRADFYIVDNQVYFGELTFTPSGGFDSARLKDTNRHFGSLLKIIK